MHNSTIARSSLAVGAEAFPNVVTLSKCGKDKDDQDKAPEKEPKDKDGKEFDPDEGPIIEGPQSLTVQGSGPELAVLESLGVEIPEGGANGVLLTQGGRFGGWCLYMKDGKPIYTYNYLGLERFTVASSNAVPQGAATSVWAATAPELADHGGAYLLDCQISEPLQDENASGGYAPWAYDEASEKRLWTESEKLTGVRFE